MGRAGSPGPQVTAIAVKRRRPSEIDVLAVVSPSPSTKPNAFVKQMQRQLDMLLQEANVEWARVRPFIGIANVNPNHTDSATHLTTLHRCAYAGEAKVVKWCLDTGADVNARTTIGRAAMHYASDGNSPSCIRVLIDGGADASQTTLSGLTPLHVACSWNNVDAALALLCTNQVIDIDGEAGSDAQTAESMTKDATILEAIACYREGLDEVRKAELVERALLRLFRVFDRERKSYLMPEESAESQFFLSQHLNPRNPSECLFEAAEQRFHTRVLWDEFRQTHLSIIHSLGGELGYCVLMAKLCALEAQFFQEALRVGSSGTPVVTPRARAMAQRRACSPDGLDLAAWPENDELPIVVH